MRRDLEEELYVAELFAFYGGLLTERQFEISRLYYNEDQSLAEIADNFGITRQGVRDAIKRGEGTILLGPGRWGTTTPSLGVPVHFMEINRFDCIAELAYSSHGLRPELSYGSHFFQDLVEAGSFYVALYPGEDGCVFQDTLFADCENVYAQLMPSDAEDVMADVIRVYDLGKDQTILYSEVGSQTCFLAKV